MVSQSSLNSFKDKFNLGKVAYYPSIASTNDTAMEWLEEGCPNYSLIFADKQTKGKGRSNRIWYTLPQSALALSFIITKPGQEISLLPGIAALAVYDAISTWTSSDVKIKWPNDVLIERKKVCGVLMESQWAGNQLQGIVLGIGVNITSSSLNFEEEVRYPAAFLEMFTAKNVSRSALLEEIIFKLIEWDSNNSHQEVIQSWNKRLAFLGEEITAVRNETTAVTGALKGVSDTGNLLLEMHNGETIEYTANEIQLNI